MAITDRIKTAWNAFRAKEEAPEEYYNIPGPVTSFRPDRPRLRYFNERSIISSIYTRIAIDVAAIGIHHVKIDDNDRYVDDINGPFNRCLTLEPNLDQAPRAFQQDIVSTMFDYGMSAIVPVDTSIDPTTGDVVDIYTLRVGNIIEWYPNHVKINLYNEAKGLREEIILEKKSVAIVENPLYAVMNEPNSTLQRLISKLQLLDTSDEMSSGKLDLIIQLPYVIKSEARREQAAKRREEIEFQLRGGKYGIAYTDGTEKVVQLNRPAENSLLPQVEYLTNMLYGQLGITEEVMNGTADEKAMINYFSRTVEPILEAIVQAMQRSFLGVLGTNRKERVRYFRDPFKLVPLSEIAEIADKFSRNEILSANEIRSFMGLPPSIDPKADQLVNSNMPQPEPPVESGFNPSSLNP